MTAIRKLTDSDKTNLEDYLSNYPDTTMFLRGNIRQAGLVFSGQRHGGDYWGCLKKDGAITGVVALFWNGNIMMQADSDTILRDILDYARQEIDRPIAGVLGDEKLARVIKDAFGFDGHEYMLDACEKLYALNLADLIIPQAKDEADYAMVHASQIAEDVLRQWCHDYEVEAIGRTPGEELELFLDEQVSRRQKRDSDTWVLLRNNVPVCFSGFNARLPDTVQIGPVWTPVDCRSQGYARLLVAKTLEKARDEGVVKSILFTNLPQACKAYEAAGFKRVGNYQLSLLSKPLTL